MKKADAEKGIRTLCRTWVATLSLEKRDHPSFSDFKAWLRANGYGDYLDFKSPIAGAQYDAEMWFDNELRQRWRT